MTDKPAPKRARVRATKNRIVEGMEQVLAGNFSASRPLPPILTAADLRAELDALSATRTQVTNAITATAEQHARLTSDLTRVDGALQIVGQLIERLEAKGA